MTAFWGFDAFHIDMGYVNGDRILYCVYLFTLFSYKTVIFHNVWTNKLFSVYSNLSNYFIPSSSNSHLGVVNLTPMVFFANNKREIH